jgi:hypothetical protein
VEVASDWASNQLCAGQEVDAWYLLSTSDMHWFPLGGAPGCWLQGTLSQVFT